MHSVDPIARDDPLPVVDAAIADQRAEPRQLLRGERDALPGEHVPARAASPCDVVPPERIEQPRSQPLCDIARHRGEFAQGRVCARVGVLERAARRRAGEELLRHVVVIVEHRWRPGEVHAARHRQQVARRVVMRDDGIRIEDPVVTRDADRQHGDGLRDRVDLLARLLGVSPLNRIVAHTHVHPVRGEPDLVDTDADRVENLLRPTHESNSVAVCWIGRTRGVQVRARAPTSWAPRARDLSSLRESAS